MIDEEAQDIVRWAALAMVRAQWAALDHLWEPEPPPQPPRPEPEPPPQPPRPEPEPPPAPPARRPIPKAEHSVIDPEALLLTTLAFAEDDPELQERVRWWASAGASFTNWGRMKRMAGEYGPRAEERIAQFASIRKKRTPILVKLVDNAGGWVEPDEASEPDLMEWPALMLRLRGAFGVSARADIMAFLMGSHMTHASVEEISHYLLYSKASVREALEGLRRGGGLEGSDTQPAYYSIVRGPWLDALGMRPELAHRRTYWPDWLRLGAQLVWQRDTGRPPNWYRDPIIRLSRLEDWVSEQL